MIGRLLSGLDGEPIRITGLPNPVDPEKYPKAFTGPWIRFFDHYTVFMRMSELSNPDIPAAETQSSYHLQTNWYPWMHMADHAGGVANFESGVKFFSVDELPEKFRADSERLYPGVFDEPEKYTIYTNRHIEYMKQEDARAG